MRLHLAKRHFFANESGIKDLEDYLPHFSRIAQNAVASGTRGDLTFWLSTPNAPVGELAVRVRDALSSIRTADWNVVYDTNGQTACEKTVGQLFPDRPPAGEDPILALCCMDQYPLDEPDQYAQFVELARKTLRDKTAYANGSRSVPVLLGSDAFNSDLRAVHELFNTLAADAFFGAPVFRTPTPSWADPSPWYERFGESTSGAYVTNPQGRGYDWIKHELQQHRAMAKKPQFSIDYVIAVMAGMIGSTSTGYVTAVRNPFPPGVDPAAQLAKFRTLIDVSLTDLAQTAARPALEELMRTEKYREIEEFFPAQTVDEVAQYARKALR